MQNFPNNFIIILFIVTPLYLIAQNPCQRFDKNYIPVHLEDALQYLDCRWSVADKDTFRNKKEDLACGELHRQYGMRIRNSWGLWGKQSYIVTYFNKLGVFHADEMSDIIFRSFHRRLSGKNLNVTAQIETNKAFQEQMKKYIEEAEKEAAKTPIDRFKEYNILDTLIFSFKYGFVSDKQQEKWNQEICFVHGILLEKQVEKWRIKVRLIEACDEKGIIAHRIKKIFQKEVLEIMQLGEERWFDGSDWQKNNLVVGKFISR